MYSYLLILIQLLHTCDLAGIFLTVSDMGDRRLIGDTMATGLWWSCLGVQGQCRRSWGMLAKYWISFSVQGTLAILSGEGRLSGLLPSLLPLLSLFLEVVIFLVFSAGVLLRSTMWTAGLPGYNKHNKYFYTQSVLVNFPLVYYRHYTIYHHTSLIIPQKQLGSLQLTIKIIC